VEYSGTAIAAGVAEGGSQFSVLSSQKNLARITGYWLPGTENCLHHLHF
jgi:hypothetical protein